MTKPEQVPLFDLPTESKRLWTGMPEFDQRDLTSESSVKVHFANDADRDAFSAAVGQKVLSTTRAIWYPAAEIGRYADRRYVSDAGATRPKYPIYVISKGRAESRLTVKSLDKIGVAHKVVVEPQEFDEYAAVIDPRHLLVLPFSDLGQGSIPVRNWVWDHAVDAGAERHWILDDNIGGFYRLNRNLKTPVGDGAIFRSAESFVDRYENVALSGFNYFMFAKRKNIMPELYLNTRIYSCILIQNDIPHRWRGRYNEDTDLSLRVLKDGWTTVLFNAFLCGKSQTMSMKGGNTEELYSGDGRLQMAESLRDQHPDVTRIVEKWGRFQHHVDYRGFRENKLKPRAGTVEMFGNDIGMALQIDTPGE